MSLSDVGLAFSTSECVLVSPFPYLHSPRRIRELSGPSPYALATSYSEYCRTSIIGYKLLRSVSFVLYAQCCDIERISELKMRLCHFFEFFPRHTAQRIRLCATVCSGKEGISSKFLRKLPHVLMVYDLKLDGFGPPIPPRRFFDSSIRSMLRHRSPAVSSHHCDALAFTLLHTCRAPLCSQNAHRRANHSNSCRRYTA